MADIKTRDTVKGTIKTIDKAVVEGERMKKAYIQTKDKAENSNYAKENSAQEYASDQVENGIDRGAHEAIYQFDKQGRKGLETTKQNVTKAKDGIRQFKEKRAAESLKRQSVRTTRNDGIKAVEHTEKAVKQTARSSGKKTIKTVGKSSVKTAEKSIKTAEKTAKTSIKTSKEVAKAAQKTAQTAAKAAQRAAQAAKATAKAVATGVKATVKATIAAIKAIIAATKALIAAIAAGGWIAVVVIIVICLIALLLGSVFGIFFSGEDAGTGMTMQTVVQEINADYNAQLQEKKDSVTYDVLEMSGGRAVWKDVLAVYAVKANADQEVASMDDSKKQILNDIFWEMNEISSRTETKTETQITETDDGHGNIVQTETSVTRTYLYITVTHKTVNEMADKYSFNQKQKDYLAELLKDENNSLWSAVLYGISYSEDQIVNVAMSQIGNVGGEPYWSWYGFNSRVEWCACFLSWCADQCGYIDTGVIPKFANCEQEANWFKDRGLWHDNTYEPKAGDVIFFDWSSDGGQDGICDHVGIVEKVENDIVYAVEGNSNDSCRVNQYSVGHFEILGYATPLY